MIKPWELTVAVTTYTAGGFVAVQCQSLGSDGSPGYFVAHHTYGFRGKPLDADQTQDPTAGPVVGAGAQVLIGFEGERGHAWLCEDPRQLPNLPDEGSGGSLHYAVMASGKASYVLLNGSDGSATIHVDDSGGPIKLEHGSSGPSIQITETEVDLGGTGGAGVVVDDGSFAAWVAAISTKAGVAPPAGLFTSTKVKAVKV